MKLEDIKQVVVVGAGNMGAQLAQLAAQVGGYQVVMTDTTDELVSKGLQRQRNALQKFFVDKGKMTADEMQAIIGRIKGTTNFASAVSKAATAVAPEQKFLPLPC